MAFFDAESVELHPWLACPPDLSPMSNLSSMVAERVACHHISATIVDELWHLVEAALTTISVHAKQSLYDSTDRHITAVIAAGKSCF